MQKPRDPSEAGAIAAHTSQMLAKTQAILAEDPSGPRILEAFLAAPRHLFVERYRSIHNQDWHHIDDGSLAEHLPRIYRDEPIVTKADLQTGAVLSTLSAPSIIAQFLAALRLDGARRFLEVGSGRGWMLALARHIMSHGHIFGIEIHQDLVEASNRNVRRLSLRNVEAYAADGAAEPPAVVSDLDRVVFTAAVNQLPRWLFSGTTESALVLAPFVQDHSINVAYLFEKQGNGFTSVQSMPGYFVPMTGRLSTPSDWTAVGGDSTLANVKVRVEGVEGEVQDWWPVLYDADNSRVFEATAGFRAFLAIVEDGSFVFYRSNRSHPERHELVIGITDDADGSVAFVTRRSIATLNGAGARRKLEHAWQLWNELGRPTLSDMDLRIDPADAPVSATGGPSTWTKRRTDCVLTWHLKTPAIRKDRS
ncbi:hypothetical protein TSH100_15320 [Azospirillum sp. TSH100]|uniref:protein-L-isoaspartate O-methyltransferase family protein n=1 Tax=Azospirillum sp. TSH100 TaxID=652764 RepID=UPI000D607ED1|nr:methyltransferase domain-containing protein [Azospirillum sp. TSH100]PWC85517.1 hypothetical protein TSH100_15320 [Azospirillum sp. TSH100]